MNQQGTTIEHDVAKKIFEIAQVYLPWRDKKKLMTWEALPDEAKRVWFEKAREVIKLIEKYCPFSREYILESNLPDQQGNRG